MTKKNIKNKKNGFTLIELLVVVAVLGLLATIVLFSVKDIKAKSRDTRRVGDIKSIQEALGMYNNNYQFYPIYEGHITGDDAVSNALKDDLLISQTPVDPINGPIESVVYRYYYQSLQGDTYVLEYYLETDSIHNRSRGLNIVVP